jgi:hypothetical protein
MRGKQERKRKLTKKGNCLFAICTIEILPEKIVQDRRERIV